jgi:hypothetical protein
MEMDTAIPGMAALSGEKGPGEVVVLVVGGSQNAATMPDAKNNVLRERYDDVYIKTFIFSWLELVGETLPSTTNTTTPGCGDTLRRPAGWRGQCALFPSGETDFL